MGPLRPEQRHCLNNAVLEMAGTHWEAKAHAPESFADLMSCPRLVVWDGASDQTIFRDARVNHAFRAWHDMGHVVGVHPFTLEGERAACRWQLKALLTRFPDAPEWLLEVIRREVIGQAEYYEQTGAFPADQEAFHEKQWS